MLEADVVVKYPSGSMALLLQTLTMVALGLKLKMQVFRKFK